MSAERMRLEEAARYEKHWKRWGPYLAERAWGNPREDYSADEDAWSYFRFEHAHARAYRWTEDGICGICDNHQRLCLSFAFWNGQDPILKERLFGLGGPAGNHGEDVKEYYYYLDSTPTHSYMKALYKYPQLEFPYAQLTDVSQHRTRMMPEYELIDTGILNEDRYFDIFIEFAKADVNDIAVRATIVNRGPDPARVHFIPTLWFRNIWAWGYPIEKPELKRGPGTAVDIAERSLGAYRLWFEGTPELLFTDNETNTELFWGKASNNGFYKDAFHQYIIHSRHDVVNPHESGTKACGVYRLDLQPAESRVIHLRLSDTEDQQPPDFEALFSTRIAEANEFYSFAPETLSEDGRNVQRQALGGLLWSKQFYHFVVQQWLDGDPAFPPPPPQRKQGRNKTWIHLFSEDVLSMPDKWEYPWFAAWDLAFHMIPMAMVDPDFAKDQLGRFLREWYMAPDGQLPAYEWEFSDVNPPVHAWACWRVFKIDWRLRGSADYEFLEAAFHKLLMNFTWWVNRKDSQGNNIFEGGFLGLDNIGVFDRSKPLPAGGFIEQADATAWMAMYCLTMLRIAFELTPHDRAYEDIASKFFEHFLHIATAVNGLHGGGLWDEQDGFYYDSLKLAGGVEFPVRVRSMVGLIPLFAVATIEQEEIDRMPGFARRMNWFIQNRGDLCGNIASITRPGKGERRLLSVVGKQKLVRILGKMLDENEFLSTHGIRSLSRYHQDHPFVLPMGDNEHRVDYEPAEATSGLFGGNSNWRGPVWFPVNYLLIESLQRFHHYFGDDLTIEFPARSGKPTNLGEIANELSRRLSRIFLRDAAGRRAVYGATEKFQTDPHFRDYILFHEYFHADNGAGLGASHQTGWTALVAKLLQQSGE